MGDILGHPAEAKLGFETRISGVGDSRAEAFPFLGEVEAFGVRRHDAFVNCRRLLPLIGQGKGSRSNLLRQQERNCRDA